MSYPKFTPGEPMHSNATFWGRLQNIMSQLNPMMLLVSGAEVDAAKDLLSRHAEGKAPEATDEMLWKAQELKAVRWTSLSSLRAFGSRRRDRARRRACIRTRTRTFSCRCASRRTRRCSRRSCLGWCGPADRP